jgi:hypothetical protein
MNLTWFEIKKLKGKYLIDERGDLHKVHSVTSEYIRYGGAKCITTIFQEHQQAKLRIATDEEVNEYLEAKTKKQYDNPQFFKCILVPIETDKVLETAYSDNKRALHFITNGEMTLQERLPDCTCEECGKKSWFLLPKEGVAVRTGGKPYIECLNCGFVTHL